MKRELKLKEGEKLSDWCSRLADYLAEKQRGRKEIGDIIRMVSLRSYTEGSNAMYKILTNQMERREL